MKGITFCSIRGRYLENGCKRLEEITKYKIPDADTVYTRLSKKNFKEILDEFYSIQNKILSQIKDTKDGIVVFIDEHEIPWYGEF